jgi:predicted RNA-binding Zn ribbon-like protein
METPDRVARMRIVGGNLALDFVNTRSGPPVGPADDDLFDGYAALVAWAAHVGAITESEALRLRRAAHRHPAGARKAFDHAMRLRDHLDATFRAIAADREPPARSMGALRIDEADAIEHGTLSRGRRAFVWRWSDDRSLERPLRSVVHAAVELLTAGPLGRIKSCGGCRFLFVDESKNQSRRWCSMDDCGKTEKMRRFVARRAQSGGSRRRIQGRA